MDVIPQRNLIMRGTNKRSLVPPLLTPLSVFPISQHPLVESDDPPSHTLQYTCLDGDEEAKKDFEKASEDTGDCVYCNCGFVSNSDVQSDLERIHDEEDAVFSRLGEKGCAKHVAEMYNAIIYKPLREQEQRRRKRQHLDDDASEVPTWTEETVRRHFTNHGFYPQWELTKDIKTSSRILDHIRFNGLVTVDSEGKKKIDQNGFKSWREGVKIKADLMKQLQLLKATPKKTTIRDAPTNKPPGTR